MPTTLKRGLHFCGNFLAILGIFVVAMRLGDYAHDIDFSHFRLIDWFLLGGLALIYAGSNIILALAWRSLLAQFGAETSFHWAIRTYGISQIAKYIPGNILHLASRQVMGVAAGVKGWCLVKSVVWELGLLAMIGGCFGILALPLLNQNMPANLATAVFLAALIISIALLKCFAGNAVARAAVWYAVFLAISGMLFIALVELVAGNAINTLETGVLLIGAYTFAWLAGLVTPGAPAGIGVREFVLLMLLNGIFQGKDLLLAIVLGRCITATGDSVYYFASSYMDAEK